MHLSSMKITVLVVGKTDEKYIKEGCDIFAKRLKHYTKFEYVEIPNNKKWNALAPDERKKREGEQILKQLDNTDFLMLLDEKGKQFTSRKFSKFIEQKTVQGTRRLVLVIGGAFGFSDEVYARAKDQLSLSAMTFSHQMIRVFLFEQIYRAYTIMKNEPYHND